MRKIDFIKTAVGHYAISIGALIRELIPHYTFLQNWEVCDTGELEEVLHVYKYWLGVELSHKEYVLKCNSFPPDEWQEMLRKRIHMLRRMYRELPEDLQKEVIR